MQTQKIVVMVMAIAFMQIMCGCSSGKGAEETAVGTGGDVLSWEEQYDLGMRYLLEGNYEEAILAFNAAIEIEPKRAELYAGRGDVYMQSGKDEEMLALAQADYEMALTLDETNAEAYLGLADVYLYQGEYEKALETLQVGLEKTGNNTAIAGLLAELEGRGSLLSIEIKEWEFFEGGFYHDIGNGEQYYMDWSRGICGQFRFSRELTDSEKDNVWHSGRWLDMSGNKIADNNCWAYINPGEDHVYRGWFAIEIPDDMSPGTYIYELSIDIMENGATQQEMTASTIVTIQ